MGEHYNEKLYGKGIRIDDDGSLYFGYWHNGFGKRTNHICISPLGGFTVTRGPEGGYRQTRYLQDGSID